MRSYKNPDIFFQKMKKKQPQQEVIDNISNYSDNDIDNLTGPHFPQWIKDQLKKLNKRNGKTSEQIANEIAEKMNAASRHTSPYSSMDRINNSELLDTDSISVRGTR